MLKYIIIGVICCLALETNATTVLLSDYKAPKNEEFKAFNELYLTGVMEGLLTFNAKLATDGKPKLFCLPPKKEVTTVDVPASKKTASVRDLVLGRKPHGPLNTNEVASVLAPAVWARPIEIVSHRTLSASGCAPK